VNINYSIINHISEHPSSIEPSRINQTEKKVFSVDAEYQTVPIPRPYHALSGMSIKINESINNFNVFSEFSFLTLEYINLTFQYIKIPVLVIHSDIEDVDKPRFPNRHIR